MKEIENEKIESFVTEEQINDFYNFKCIDVAKI